jgi:hypothetical protein
MKEWLAGKKTYLTAAAGLIGIVVAWSTGEIGTVDALTAAFVAIQTVFIRLGIAKQ